MFFSSSLEHFFFMFTKLRRTNELRLYIGLMKRELISFLVVFSVEAVNELTFLC